MTHARLPGGLWRDGAAVRELALRPVDAGDHMFLLDTQDSALAPGVRATALLQRCLVDAPPGTASRLSIGDREALLLQLRQRSVGEAIEGVLRCPSPACGEPMELALRAGALLLPPYAEPAPAFRRRFEHAGACYDLVFRLPTAGDLDEVAALAALDPGMAGEALLFACLEEAWRDGAAIDAAALPAPLHDALAAAMAECDPQAELEIDLACPVCGHAFSALFDSASFLLQELDARAAQAVREVHVLASHYGWSEHDILAMPARRRARYLGLIALEGAGA